METTAAAAAGLEAGVAETAAVGPVAANVEDNRGTVVTCTAGSATAAEDAAEETAMAAEGVAEDTAMGAEAAATEEAGEAGVGMASPRMLRSRLEA